MYPKLVTAPESEPITLAEFKAHIDYSASDRDDYQNALITTAREYCEKCTRRSLYTQTRQLSMDAFGGSLRVIELPYGPVQSITSVVYVDENGDSQTISADNYQLDNNREPARLAPARLCTWPSTDNETLAAVTITYVTGWDDTDNIPTGYKHAIKLLAAHWWEHPEAVTMEGTPHYVPMTVRLLMDLENQNFYG